MFSPQACLGVHALKIPICQATPFSPGITMGGVDANINTKPSIPHNAQTITGPNAQQKKSV